MSTKKHVTGWPVDARVRTVQQRRRRRGSVCPVDTAGERVVTGILSQN